VGSGYSLSGAFLSEVLGTVLLKFVVLSAVDKNTGHPERMDMKQSHSVATIGLCVTMAHCVLVPITSCSISPARSFGASVVAGKYPDNWFFWVAPILGGQISAFVYEVILKDRPGWE
jgi:glycerol uptake facilitator-like aquaporin